MLADMAVLLLVLAVLLPLLATGYASAQAQPWSKLSPETSPLPRAFHDMAYDAGSHRIILFGGLTESANVLGDTWAYDADRNTWVEMNPAAAPAARSSHALSYDAAEDRVILFGGVQKVGGSFVEVNDTWAYDFDTNSWTNRNPAVAPSPRLGHRMAFDNQSTRTVLLSGHRGQGPGATLFHDTWAYDFGANEWTEMAPSSAPSAGNHGSLVYDAESDRILHFGGESSPSAYSDETWHYSFDANSWTEVQPSASPSPRFAHAMAHDTDSDRTVLFGGSSGSDETWVFNLNANEWEQRSPPSHPSGRLGHRMAYDSQSDRVILFGGGPNLFGPYDDETWAFDLDSLPPAPTFPWLLVAALASIIVAVAAVAFLVWRRRSKAGGGGREEGL